MGAGDESPVKPAQFRVQLIVRECRESAAGVIEEHDLLRSEDTGGNDKLSEHIFGYRWPAGSDDVDIGLRQPQYSREV